ncbi:MAG: ABC transporter substrate-binding protein [Bryobacterales bacterium]|nr:ABC transporter substrate-binding protein [Bryobacterales bacterium]
MRRRFRTAAPSLVFLLALAGSSHAQDDGVSEDRVLFGQSAVFSGPNGQLGMDFRIGVLAAFGEANAGGGVHGRRLELLSIDDFYDPAVAVANTRRLVEQDRVFALIGSVGAPCARAPGAQGAGSAGAVN